MVAWTWTYVASQRSLDRLGVARLDLVQLHWWDYGVGDAGVGAGLALAQLQAEGLIDQIGLTNFDTPRMAAIVDAGVGVVSNQVQYSLLDRRPEAAMVPYCASHGIALLCYGVLAGGFLTDRWLGALEPTVNAPQENRSLTKYALMIDEFGGWALFQELLRLLRAIADAHVVGGAGAGTGAGAGAGAATTPATVAQVSVAWVLAKPCVGGVIIGSRNARHIASTVGGAALVLRPAELGAIEALLARGGQPADGSVFGAERDITGRHGSVMRYNLNHIGSAGHLREVVARWAARGGAAPAVVRGGNGERGRWRAICAAVEEQARFIPLAQAQAQAAAAAAAAAAAELSEGDEAEAAVAAVAAAAHFDRTLEGSMATVEELAQLEGVLRAAAAERRRIESYDGAGSGFDAARLAALCAAVQGGEGGGGGKCGDASAAAARLLRELRQLPLAAQEMRAAAGQAAARAGRGGADAEERQQAVDASEALIAALSRPFRPECQGLDLASRAAVFALRFHCIELRAERQ